MADAVTVAVQRSGRRFEAEALLDLDADVRTVWNTITDHPAMPSYMPGIRAVRVLEHRGSPGSDERPVAEQQGEFGFMMFAQAMKLRLNIEPEPHRMTEATAVHFETGRLGRRASYVFIGRCEPTPLKALAGAVAQRRKRR